MNGRMAAHSHRCRRSCFPPAMTNQRVKHFGRRLGIIFFNRQTQMKIVFRKVESLFLPKMLAPVELLPTSEIMAALKVLAALSAWSNPTSINLLVLPPTICWASPKKPFHCVGFHCSWADTLAIHYTTNLNYCDVCYQQ